MKWLQNLVARKRLYSDLAEEIRQHLEEKTEALMAEGRSRKEAELIARREFGNPALIEENARETWRFLRWESMAADLRFGLRQMRKAPGFSAAVIATLALGVGANVAIFSIVDAVLLRPLPYENPDRLVVVWQSDAAHRDTGGWFDTYREFQAWQQENRSFEKLSALTWARNATTMMWQNRPMNILAIPASAGFFSMLGAEAAVGRTFSEGDVNTGCTVVLSHRFWQQKLGAPADIAGQHLEINRSPCRVAGVMPEQFSFYPKQTEAWMLITPDSDFARNPWGSMTGVFGRLRHGVSRAAAEAELQAIQNRILPEAPANLGMMRNMTPVVLGLQNNFTWLAGRNLRTGLWALFGAVGLVLLLACVNVANLLLGRAMERSQEMAVRASLGSGRGRLLRQLLTESLLLALCGTAGGVALALVILRWFHAANPVELPPGNGVDLDWRTLLFSAGLGICSTVCFGLLPAWRGSKADLNTVLKSGGRSASVAGSAHRLSQALVIMQVGLSLALLTGAGLLAESLRRLATAPLGYRTGNILTASISFPPDRYRESSSKANLYDRLSERIGALAGVQMVSAASDFLPNGGSMLSVQGAPAAVDQPGVLPLIAAVDRRYFDLLQIPLRKGRNFDTRDRHDAQPVAIVNEALVNRYFPNADPIGRAIKLSRADDATQPWLTIIGVVGNVKTSTVFREMGYLEEPAVYRALPQDSRGRLAVMVLSKEDATPLTTAIQKELETVDRELVLYGAQTMEARLYEALSQPRFRTLLFGGFSLVAVLLSVVGLHGLLAQFVSQRKREIGIRMALGAGRGKILRSVVRRALVVVVCGIGLGTGASLVIARLIANLLYEVPPQSPGVFSLAAGAMLGVAVFAVWSPAFRAASVDPMQTLRAE